MNGKQVLPCKVNGITLKFTIDTGENDATISLTDALFLLKNGYASISDLSGTEYERFTFGHVNSGTTLLLKQLTIGNTNINNVIAAVSTDLKTPLILGQKAMSRLEKIEFDYTNQMITLKGGTGDIPVNVASNPSPTPNLAAQTVSIPVTEITPTENMQKLLVKVNTNLYALPNQGPAIHPVFSNTFVHLIGEANQNQNYLYVDYHGKKGYINRLALDTK